MIKPFNIIVATDQQRGIGKDGDLPWRLPQDLKFFKDVTTKEYVSGTKNAVIMGRKTWESIPEKFRPLPGRVNVVCTRNKELNFGADVLKANDLPQAFDQLSNNIGEIFIIGGQQIFEQALQLPSCKGIYLTQIDSTFDCDTFFPVYTHQFELHSSSERLIHANFSFQFIHLKRR